MNKTILIGRLTRDPDVRYTKTSKGDNMAIARYNLAIDRKGKDAGTDYISCVAFGKLGEFAEKYLKQGVKIAVVGRIQTGSYTNKDGIKVYTTDVVVEEHEFCESKNSENTQPAANVNPNNDTHTENNQPSAPNNSFMDVPDDILDDLPFK
jgi:single-strand DNA-binding protein